VDVVKGFDDALVAAGVPSGIPLPNYGEHLDIRVYPQIKPIVIDWIRNFRSRLSPGMPWQRIKWSFQGITKCSGEQPEVVAALITEFRNLLDVDFEKVTPSEEYNEDYRGGFLENFSLAIAFAAGPGDYNALRELVFDPKSNPFCWTLLGEYFIDSDNDDLPFVVGKAFLSFAPFPAAEIAGRRGFTQFLPEVREIVRRDMAGDDHFWKNQLETALDQLEKKDYADTHRASSIGDLIRDLDDDGVAPYAAHLLGVRKDRRAFGPLQAKAAHANTRLRREVKRALDVIDRHHLNSGVDWLGGETPDLHQAPFVTSGESDCSSRNDTTEWDRPDFAVPLDAFFEDLLAVGIPSAGARSQADEIVHPDMRVYPQIEPVLIDWVGNFRSRVEQEFLWPQFLLKIHGIAMASGEQPRLVTALLAEFWNLVDLDFTEFEIPEKFGGDPEAFKTTFVSQFCIPIVCASSPADYPELRKIVFDEKGSKYCVFPILDYFGLAESDDVPVVLLQASKVPDYSIKCAVAVVAAVRGFTQFLPFVRDLADQPNTAAPADEWCGQLGRSLYDLERQFYVENNQTTRVGALIRDLERPDIAPYAAYALGQRRDRRALRHLKRETRSRNEALRYEAAAAFEAITGRAL